VQVIVEISIQWFEHVESLRRFWVGSIIVELVRLVNCLWRLATGLDFIMICSSSIKTSFLPY
jgi:hypothetical protein